MVKATGDPSALFTCAVTVPGVPALIVALDRDITTVPAVVVAVPVVPPVVVVPVVVVSVVLLYIPVPELPPPHPVDANTTTNPHPIKVSFFIFVVNPVDNMRLPLSSIEIPA
jgi:hypothetical protein